MLGITKNKKGAELQHPSAIIVLRRSGHENKSVYSGSWR